MKKFFFTITALSCFISLFAQEIDFSGVYRHDFEGETSYLEIIQENGNISGELHDYRGIYFLHGETEEKRAKGLINLGDNTNFFEMDMLGDHLHLYIIDMTEYGEPNYATQYDLLFIKDSTAEKPEKTKVNPFSDGSNDKSEYASGGIVNAPYLGIQFKKPKDFRAENNGSDIILRSNKDFSSVFIFRHDFDDIDKLEGFLKKGYSDEEMNLIISEISKESDSLLSFDAKGYFGGNSVLAKGVSNIGPYGSGVIVFYLMKEAEKVAGANEELDLIMNSMNFYPVTQHPLSQRWILDLKGKSLKYGSSSSSGVVSSTLMRKSTWINLCPDMTFKMVEPKENNEKKVLEGKWNVDVHYGIPHLSLYADNNDIQIYKLHHENGRLLMNRERWMVLKGFESECGNPEQE